MACTATCVGRTYLLPDGVKRRPIGFCVLLPAVLLAACAPAAAEPSPPASKAAIAAYREALSDWEAGKQQAAITGFSRAAQLAPAWGAPNARLGVIYQLQDREDDARTQYALVQAASLGQPQPQLSEDELRLRQLIIDGEAYLTFLVNAARLQQGQPVLVPDPTVNLVARRHSEEMRDKGYFSHTSPTPGLTSCQDRFRAIFGYKPRLIGENVARRWGTLFSLCEAKLLDSHQDLMNSPGHRRNILYPSVQWLGVGIAANANGDYWVTEVFVEPGQ